MAAAGLLGPNLVLYWNNGAFGIDSINCFQFDFVKCPILRRWALGCENSQPAGPSGQETRSLGPISIPILEQLQMELHVGEHSPRNWCRTCARQIRRPVPSRRRPRRGRRGGVRTRPSPGGARRPRTPGTWSSCGRSWWCATDGSSAGCTAQPCIWNKRNLICLNYFLWFRHQCSNAQVGCRGINRAFMTPIAWIYLV